MHRVRMVSRTRCGLCDRAREVVLTLRETIDFAFEEVLVDGDDALERAYGLRVPVVLVDDIEQFETEVDPARLTSLLA